MGVSARALAPKLISADLEIEPPFLAGGIVGFFLPSFHRQRVSITIAIEALSSHIVDSMTMTIIMTMAILLFPLRR